MDVVKTQHAIDRTRKDKFLETLRLTGSFARAASAATPWATGSKHGEGGFRRLMRVDPEFAAEVAAARQEFLGQVERVIAEHALEGVEEPVFHQGQVVGHVRKFDHNLLLRLAARLDPDWSPASKVEATLRRGEDERLLSISPDDVLLLDEDERRRFCEMLQKIGDRKACQTPTT